MESLEVLVRKMESQMDRADSKLDTLSMRLDQFESKVIIPHEGNSSVQENHLASDEDKIEEVHSNGEGLASENAVDDDDDSGLDPKLLTDLLVDVRRVKKEYDQLLTDVHQVQELQQEVTRSLRKQMKQVQNHFEELRERVIGSKGNGVVPTNK